MRIALLSDVHANLPALRAALAVAGGAGAKRVVVAGDLVGDGPHPREVIAELRRRGVVAIRGNVDRKVLGHGTGRAGLERRLRETEGQARNRVWTALRLLDSPEERDWLATLPAERSLDIGEHRVLVVHGSPLGDTDYLYPSLTPRGLRGKLAGRERPDVLVSGHSHVPFVRAVDGVVVINCGSVGRPADGDPRGALSLLEVGRRRRLRAEIVRFPYPVGEVARAIRTRRVPGIDPVEYRLGVKS